jgi:hypothetical protein
MQGSSSSSSRGNNNVTLPGFLQLPLQLSRSNRQDSSNGLNRVLPDHVLTQSLSPLPPLHQCCTSKVSLRERLATAGIHPRPCCKCSPSTAAAEASALAPPQRKQPSLAPSSHLSSPTQCTPGTAAAAAAVAAAAAGSTYSSSSATLQFPLAICTMATVGMGVTVFLLPWLWARLLGLEMHT